MNNSVLSLKQYCNSLVQYSRRKTIEVKIGDVPMGDIGKISDETKFRNEGDKIYTFKPQPHRFLSFFEEGKKIIVTNAFWKKQDKLPQGEKDKALNSMNSYKQRIKEGTYYEKEK